MIAKYCYILVFLLPFALYSQTQTQRLVDSSGGLVWSSVSNAIAQQITVFVRQGDTIFAAHDGLGVIFSTDDGRNWQRSGMTLPTQALTTNGSRLYAVANRTPYYSDNAGVSWIPAGYIDSAISYHYKITMVASGNNAAVLCTHFNYGERGSYYSQLYVTQNGGSVWKKRPERFQRNNTMVFLGDILIATDIQSTTNLSYSLDVGKSWLPLPTFPEHILQLYTSGTKLYVVGISRKIFISSDSAKTWKRCTEIPDFTFRVPFPFSPEQQGNSGLPFNIQQGIGSIEGLSISDSGKITICLRNSLIFSSDDDGNSWKLINSQLWKGRSYVASIVLTTLTSIIIGGREGVFRCNTDGKNLQKVCASSFDDSYWFSQCNENYNLFVTTGTRKKTYFLSGNAGLFRSNDGWIWQQIMPQMHRWKATNPIDPFEFVHPIESKAYFSSLDGDYCINALAGNDEAIIAITKSGTVLRSSDNGSTWIPIRQEQRFVSDNALLHLQQSTLTAFLNGTAFRSDDYGRSWQEIPSIKNLGISKSGKNAIKSVASNKAAILAVTEQEFFRSLDGGITWSKHTISLNIRSIRNITANEKVAYVATDRGVFRSLDNGVTWQESNGELAGQDNKDFTTSILAIDNIIITMIDGNDTFFSLNFGKNWRRGASIYSFYSSQSTTIESIKTLVTNNSSIIGLTKENTLYRTDIPIDLGIDFQYLFTNNEESRANFAPNPTQGIIKFSWNQKNYANVSIGIYDMSGRIVGGFTNYQYAPGTYSYIWDASTMATGAYFCRYTIGEKVYSGMISVQH